MTRRQPKLPTPSTAQFHDYITRYAKPLLYRQHSRPLANQLMLVLYYLEHQRYDFSKDRAYQTRPICIHELAEHFEVTDRSVQRWLAMLEALAIIRREYRKDPDSRFRNKFSRIALGGFKAWFARTLEAAKQAMRDTARHPPKKAIFNSSFSTEQDDEDKETPPPFPASGAIRYSPYWYEIAVMYLPGGSKRPCTTLVADRFRANLRQYSVPLNHRSLPARWIKFCQNAKPAF